MFFCLSPPWPHRPLLIYLPAVPWSSIWPSPARVPACCPGWPQTPTPDGALRAPRLARGSATCPSAPVALAPPRALVLPRSATVAAAATRIRPHDPRCCGSHAIHRQRSCRPVQSGPGHRQFPNPGEIAPPGWATVILLPTELPRRSALIRTSPRWSAPSCWSPIDATSAAPHFQRPFSPHISAFDSHCRIQHALLSLHRLSSYLLSPPLTPTAVCALSRPPAPP